MDLISCTAASKMLGVSVQTLRNWDESGLLTSIRTAGGHRRYRYEDLLAHRDKNNQIISSYEIDHIAHIRKLWIEECNHDPRAKACGGFTKDEIAMILYNQNRLPDEGSLRLLNDIECFYQIASEYSSPYLVNVTPIRSYSEVIPYYRIRCSKSENSIIYRTVLETETIVCGTHRTSTNYHFDETILDEFKPMIKRFDENIVTDLYTNAATQVEKKSQKLEMVINECCDAINSKIMTATDKYVLMPPEVFDNSMATRVLNSNLKTCEGKIAGCTVYVSRLIPDHVVLVGSSGKDRFIGYSICPQILMRRGTSNEVFNFSANIGKRLMREGSNFFATIKV